MKDKAPTYQTKLMILGHRLGQQSGLYESSGRYSTIFLHGLVFRVYLALAKIGNNTKYSQIVSTYAVYLKKQVLHNKQNEKRLRQACSTVNRA